MSAFIVSVGSAAGLYMSQESFMILLVSHARNFAHVPFICTIFFFNTYTVSQPQRIFETQRAFYCIAFGQCRNEGI
jgi:hypothetical protein